MGNVDETGLCGNVNLTLDWLRLRWDPDVKVSISICEKKTLYVSPWTFFFAPLRNVPSIVRGRESEFGVCCGWGWGTAIITVALEFPSGSRWYAPSHDPSPTPSVLPELSSLPINLSPSLEPRGQEFRQVQGMWHVSSYPWNSKTELRASLLSPSIVPSLPPSQWSTTCSTLKGFSLPTRLPKDVY